MGVVVVMQMTCMQVGVMRLMPKVVCVGQRMGWGGMLVRGGMARCQMSMGMGGSDMDEVKRGLGGKKVGELDI